MADCTGDNGGDCGSCGLRSREWFEGQGNAPFNHRANLKAGGHLGEMFDGRPVIGIANSASDLVPCNSGLTDLAERAVRGVLEAGGFPLVFPTMSIGDSIMRPSGMMYRNLMSLELEELARANPVDGLVILTGCDNTAPAYAMGAASTGLPTMMIHAGPMLSGNWRARQMASGTDMYKLGDEARKGVLTPADLDDAEYGISRGTGTCNTMGTACTMGAVLESMGLSLMGTANIPAMDARKRAAAQQTGRRIVELVREGVGIADILTPAAFRNGVRTNAALGGGTNTTAHLLALAGRLGLEFSIDDIERYSREVPLLANVMPSGEYLMEDFYNAGGQAALMRSMGDLLDPDAPTVSGRTIGEEIASARVWDERVIRRRENPVSSAPALAILCGSLAPRGALIKATAADSRLLDHRGPAVVFDSIEDLDARLDSPDLEVDENSVLVLRGIGPTAYPGAPELGNFKIPRKLLDRGVTDLVRISDGRMSGTAFGAVVLQVTPEAGVGGPLALVRDGDIIHLDVANRRLDLEVDDEDLEARRRSWQPPEQQFDRGYRRLYVEHVMQADAGFDFDFLRGSSGAPRMKRRPY
ncbi:dihydroxy-acid dehydratase [Leucobacter sp. wl10]|uniref:dihydroxy-acid dehydratase n=1 Tax=Leucobacter sp. wl10 TaxID=2304677 RepID=UPI000E5A916A|nr:dihydroxy-acid dehydratase [Leucobacter sp. wl10]RGE22031.1 dihydroxy-acid dehydratase [Leucobacter sp. wl10]